MLKTGLKLPGIDKIFLLNLKHRTDRLLFQKRQFVQCNIESFYRVEPVPAVESGNFLNKSTKSIYLSHLKIIEQAMREDVTALVLEDDVEFRGGVDVTKNVLNFLFNEIKDWDMFYFYSHACCFNNKKNVIQEYENIQKIRDCLNLHAYVINKKSLGFVFDKLNNFKDSLESSNQKSDWRCHIDHVFSRKVHPHINVYGCKTLVIFQKRNIFKSDNEWVLPD
jgi:hypothetical protein